MTLLVEIFIIRTWHFAIAAWRDDSFGSGSFYRFDECVAVIAFIGNHDFWCFARKQRLCLRDVVALPAGDDEVRGIAEPVYRRVDFRGEAATAPAKALGILAPFLCRAPAAC